MILYVLNCYILEYPSDLLKLHNFYIKQVSFRFRYTLKKLYFMELAFIKV